MSEETIATAPTSAEKPSNLDEKPRKLSVKTFDFFWKRDSRRENILKKENNQKKKDLIEGKIIESKTKNAPSNKRSFNVFKGIKRHMQIKKLTIRDSKQKMKETCSLQNDTNYDSSTLHQNKCTVSVEESTLSDNKCEDTKKNSDILNSSESLTATDECTLSQNECTLDNLNEAVEGCSDIETKTESVHAQVVDNYQSDNNHETIPNMHYLFSNNNTLQIESVVAREHQVDNIEEISESNINNDKAKVSLTEELLKLSNYGWYWGPISGTEADAKLMSEPDGAFLVRDSSDDRYVLTLSFKSSGKLLHARMEHSGGLFSLCNQSESEGFSSVADLINYSMNFSQSAVFCYSRPKYPGHPSFPVRLTKPVSRFNQVRSLQYLCRFVIRQNTRLDNIHKLPLPKTIKGYIEEAHY